MIRAGSIMCMTCSKNRLEIWDKAQRESARRPKSDWGKLGGWGKISPRSESRGPNSNAGAEI